MSEVVRVGNTNEKLNRVLAAFARFPDTDQVRRDDPRLKMIRFDVIEPGDLPVDEDEVEFAQEEKQNEEEEEQAPVVDEEFVFNRYYRTCSLYLDPDAGKLAVAILDAEFHDKGNFQLVKNKEASHAWVMKLDSEPNARLTSSICQITFDVARGGNVAFARRANRVPALSYLGMPVTTNEELIAVIEALYDSWNTTLDWSTVQ